MRRKLRSLESDLNQLTFFSSPNFKLEQYQTPPRLAAEILRAIDSYCKYIEGKVVVDFGCGTGILGLGCARLGASRVIGVDIDPKAVEVAKQNASDVGLSSDYVSFLTKDVRELDLTDIPLAVDFVVMNPPFGIRSAIHMDNEFVQKGLQFAGMVFSLHKSTTREFWQSMVDWKVKILDPDIKFPIEQEFKFHKKELQFVSVDLLCHVRNAK
jgi:putative methylase